MTTTDALQVIVVGRQPEKMVEAIAVLKSYGFGATGVFSEEVARRAITEGGELFAVVTGGAVDQVARERLRAVAASKGAVLVTAKIGHDDPAVHFTTKVIPKLIAEREKSSGRHPPPPGIDAWP